ncbi:hypothetical protein C6359_10775 [Bacillus wiedmannii]|uniref:Uncharacterized protein n=1 Tax=Bacillus wiedmannii TaxID=1890302 RepID=A0A2C4QFQ6_9BACI|nr:hypothetical protein AN402_1700 [Bacillus wiedmannii]PHD63887.1 hypothetical protein COF57_02110 [Bacillus wiedmannii]PRT05792.1 hypothetical protein C6356_10580 [Bacillus wiedmannii]PRT34733.1 hypothetical protein C6358_10715 [Bacillus wiedmannii]PRT41063.1 hypothetical protein C6357_08435 [Bacillus wiedmannii]
MALSFTCLTIVFTKLVLLDLIENKIVTQMLRNIEIQFPSNSILAIIIYKNIQKGRGFHGRSNKGE